MRPRIELSPDGQGLGIGPASQAPAPAQAASKIQAFENKLGIKRHEETWKRTPNVTGTGAIHMRTFHCKLGDDAIGYLDQQINEWLDAHPQYEVKFVTTNIGEWSGKLGKENHLVVLVWV